MQTTPLYPIYQKYQANIVDFHGWALPIQFSSIIQEHLTVRKQVGLFDVSHMGEILIEGPESTKFLDFVLTNRISTLQPGSIRYSPLCFEHGGTIDDLLIYCFSENKYLLIVNASNIATDFNWLKQYSQEYHISVQNLSAATAQLAVQGPLAETLLTDLIGHSLTQLKYYQFIPQIKLGNLDVLLSRTGYTGEDGFEIYLQPEHAIELWELLITAGATVGIKPIGLGARDTLRFEASLPLYGNELSENISPLEAGLERFIKFDKVNFIGKTSLLKQRMAGISRSLIGLEMTERAIPRSNCRIFQNDDALNNDGAVNGEAIGYVTSGSYCPSLEKNMAMVLLNNNFAKINQEVKVEIRGKTAKAVTLFLPFYRRLKGVS